MYIFTKISLAMVFIIMITIIAETIGKLDTRYGYYIILIGLVIQVSMLIILVNILLTRRKELNSGVKIIRYKIEDRYVKGDADVLPTFMTTTNPRKSSIFKIHLEVKDFKEPPEFGVCKMGKAGYQKIIDIKKHISKINVGIIGDLFVCDVDMIVRPDEKINFKFRNDANIKIFFVGELYIP